jgi:hypothetical protein
MDAAKLTRNLGGKWHGRYGKAACPVCQTKRRRDQQALSLSDGADGRLLLHCHKTHCGFRDIVAALGLVSGDYSCPDKDVIAKRAAEQQALARRKAQQARQIWDETEAAAGTPAEVYLRTRGITCNLPETLRFHPSCWHASAKRYPALVARIDGGADFAIHRTYLRDDGRGKANVDPNKAMLGSVAGGAVKLKSGFDLTMIGEGIESTLSAAILYGDREMTVWAALSTGGMSTVNLPGFGRVGGLGQVRPSLIIVVDGDKAGRRAGHELAERAHLHGWRVNIMDPGDSADWNDRLIEEQGYLS